MERKLHKDCERSVGRWVMNALATVRELTQGCRMHAAVFGDIAV